MSVGFIMMVHTALDRAGAVARHWATSGCPVVIHVDRQVKTDKYNAFVTSLEDLENVVFCPRKRVEWGTWSMVAATQAAATVMLDRFAEVRHVYLASGSCLPLRPVQELTAYLDNHPQTDFIESVTTYDVPWTVGGLDKERFLLRFPFSWKNHRALFDRYVQLQRRLGYRRKLPAGLIPHLGSQWWCLTRQTLSAILESPDRGLYDRYFSKVWIPDESYFQTLARHYSTHIESRSLTLSKFDFQGKPHVFYDDHIQLLRRSDCFVARKIWPQADRLYASFLSNDPAVTKNAEPNPGKIDRLFAGAADRRIRGRAGLYMQSRYPEHRRDSGKTSDPYSVFEGFAELFENFEHWLGKTIVGRVHGHLFHPDRVHFAGGERVYNGAMSDSAKIRDYEPKSFLTNLIWNTRGERQCFQFGPGDRQGISGFIASDPNAQISVITGAWAIPLYKSNQGFADIRKQAALLQRIEGEHLEILRGAHATARVRIWTLAEFAQSPMEHLQEIIDEVAPAGLRRLSEAPKMADLAGFGQFLQNLKNQGMDPYLVGDYSVDRDPDMLPPRQTKPYLVR